MEALSIVLFGGFAVAVQGESISAFESNKVRALLAYLTVEAHTARPHQRSVLASLLWPDYPEEMARRNLRHVLRQLRQTLPAAVGSPPLLLTNYQTIQINPDYAYALDVARFVQLLAAARRCLHRTLAACADCRARYAEAALLYRGDFLAGLALHDSEPFDEWALVQREGLHRRAMELFFTLATYHEEQGDYEKAQQYAHRQLELEPWREEAHRQLMRILAHSEQRSAALAQYTQCRKILADELGVEPDAETVALYEQIRSGKLEKKIRRQGDRERGRQGDGGAGRGGRRSCSRKSKIPNPGDSGLGRSASQHLFLRSPGGKRTTQTLADGRIAPSGTPPGPVDRRTGHGGHGQDDARYQCGANTGE